jgi:hypothetical protein
MPDGGLFLNPIARFDHLFRKEHSCPVDLTIRGLPTLSHGMPPSWKERVEV